MPKIFEHMGYRKPKMSAFDLSREQKLSCKMGDLIPTYLEEVVPGDQFRVNSQVMMRLAPMLAPIMHRVDVYMHYFFVPNRIIWNSWEEFITGGRLGTSEPILPTLTWNTTIATAERKLGDYLGLPIPNGLPSGNTQVSQLPFRAYQKIWQDYYRDRNLTADLDPNTMTQSQLRTLRKRSWEKDYFTSALPFTQRGPQVSVPGNVIYSAFSTAEDTTGGTPTTGTLTAVSGVVTDGTAEPVQIQNIDSIDITINELRKTSALQRFLEKAAVGGSRYTEQLKAFFGVTDHDSRLQRAEYLGGGKQPVVISEVLNTTGTEDAPQGDMAGHGISTGSSNSFQYNVPEHGYIIGIMSVLPRTAYQQGIARHWSRAERTDYYFPEFALLGEQEIKNKELYWGTVADTNEQTFGYQQRYAEYKYGCSTVHGDFRTNLNFWTLSRIFSLTPNLNEAFVTADPSDRIFAVRDGSDYLWVQLYHDVKARRPMPYFAIPELL